MPNDNTGAIAVVNAFKAHTGSSSVARSYFTALRKERSPVRWYQCISSKQRGTYDHFGVDIDGFTWFRDDLNLVLNSVLVFPRKVGRLPEALTLLTDPVLLGAAPRLRNSIVIVHDLRELVDHRRSLLAGAYFRWLFRRLDCVGHIVCDSEATRSELLRFYDPSSPVDVLHPSTDIVGQPTAHLERSLERIARTRTLNLLCITVDRPYKNLALFCRLAQALERPRDGWSFRFRLISRIGSKLREEIDRLRLSNFEVIPSLPDVTRAYEETDVLVHPSLLEGFGLPPVEAMQFGIPIVGSDVACLREVIGSGGTLLPPDQLERWVSSVMALNNPETYARSARASAERGRAFSPDAFASRLRDWMVLRSL